MDEDKKHWDGDKQECETKKSDEKIRRDLGKSVEGVIKNQDGAETCKEDGHNVIEKSKSDEADSLLVVTEIADVKADTSAAQDLFEAIGLGFWKSKKKTTSISNENIEVNEPDVLQTNKASVVEGSIRDVLNENTGESQKELPAAIGEETQKTLNDEVTDKVTSENVDGILEEETNIFSELIEGVEGEPIKKGFKRKLLIISVIILMSFLGYRVYGFITEPRPPSEDVVASYSGKNLTKEELSTYIKSKGYKEEEHGLCEKHGFEHDKCDKTEECETHPIHSLESYRQIIKMIAVQKIVDDWAKEKGITQKDEVKHDFKHLIEEVSLDKLVDKVHKDQLSPDKIDKLEIQKYYDANKDKYKDKPFSEVEDEIRNILAAEEDKNFFPEYIEKLKKDSALNLNYDLLKVDDPTETEMKSFFEKNMDKYLEPKKAKILEIKIDISGSEDDARKKADEALTKIRGGESFGDVAKRYSSNNQFDAYYIKQGEKGTDFEDKVFDLQVDEVSSVFKDGSSFYIVKVSEKQERRQKAFSEVLNEIKTEVVKEKEDKQYELKKNEALFSIHGKRFTLGEFKQEFRELSPETQAEFAGFEAKKSLIDQLIAKELLLEESGDDSADKEGNEEVEELKNQYIQQILHKEEIDEKIGEITDEEAKKFYEEKKNYLVDPPKAKISLIRVEQGGSDAEKTRARQRIDEALEKLTGGADFATVAKEYSNDPTASAGGELNEWLYDKNLDPVLKENIFKLQPNEISDVFEYEGGYYVVKLRQKEAQKQMSFEEVKEQLKETLLDEKHHEKEAGLEDELLKKSQLVIYDSSLRKMLKEQTKTKN